MSLLPVIIKDVTPDLGQRRRHSQSSEVSVHWMYTNYKYLLYVHTKGKFVFINNLKIIESHFCLSGLSE